MTCRSEFTVGVKGAIPKQMTDGAVGFDIEAAENTSVPGYRTCTIKTGVHLNMPNNIYAHVMPRSGLASKDGVHAIVGTIDSDYRGEIGVILRNTTPSVVYIHKGMRIAQLLFRERVNVKLVSIEKLDETARGDGGFGSTGV